MSIFHAILLGVVQGLTEFLPISSTAHLTLAGKLLGLIDPAQPQRWTAFIAVIQLGTVAAVLLYFAKDLAAILHDLVRDLRRSSPATGGAQAGNSRWSPNARLAGQIVLGTLPVSLIGLAFRRVIEGYLTKEISTIATSMILLAVFLFWAEKAGRRTRTQEEATWKDALIVGIAQAAALIPGSSRSGTTITAGLFLGFRREAAARFSFLLSIPAVLASGLFEMVENRREVAHVGLLPTLVATIVAAAVGYAAIAFLLRYLRTHTTFIFIFYRVLAGLLLWSLFLAGTI